jgi:hypothetical protein
MDDCAGPASREVLLGHLSCPHSPDLARIQATLVVADNSSVDAVFNKRGGRFDSVFFLIEAPCIRLGARIAACLRSDPTTGCNSVPYPAAATLDHGAPIAK